jgi:hypothetical protein
VLSGLKRLISILTVSFFVYSTVGFLAIHPLLSVYYKYLGMLEAERPSEEELVEKLVLNKEDILKSKINFRWLDEREFKYNGDMYDIVKKEENDKQFILYCINDTKEKKLEEEFEKRVEENASNRKHKTNDSNPFKILISESVLCISNEMRKANRLVYSINYFRTYTPIFIDIPTPPPRFC